MRGSVPNGRCRRQHRAARSQEEEEQRAEEAFLAAERLRLQLQTTASAAAVPAPPSAPAAAPVVSAPSLSGPASANPFVRSSDLEPPELTPADPAPAADKSVPWHMDPELAAAYVAPLAQNMRLGPVADAQASRSTHTLFCAASLAEVDSADEFDLDLPDTGPPRTGAAGASPPAAVGSVLDVNLPDLDAELKDLLQTPPRP